MKWRIRDVKIPKRAAGIVRNTAKRSIGLSLSFIAILWMGSALLVIIRSVDSQKLSAQSKEFRNLLIEIFSSNSTDLHFDVSVETLEDIMPIHLQNQTKSIVNNITEYSIAPAHLDGVDVFYLFSFFSKQAVYQTSSRDYRGKNLGRFEIILLCFSPLFFYTIVTTISFTLSAGLTICMNKIGLSKDAKKYKQNKKAFLSQYCHKEIPARNHHHMSMTTQHFLSSSDNSRHSSSLRSSSHSSSITKPASENIDNASASPIPLRKPSTNSSHSTVIGKIRTSIARSSTSIKARKSIIPNENNNMLHPILKKYEIESSDLRKSQLTISTLKLKNKKHINKTTNDNYSPTHKHTYSSTGTFHCKRQSKIPSSSINNCQDDTLTKRYKCIYSKSKNISEQQPCISSITTQNGISCDSHVKSSDFDSSPSTSKTRIDNSSYCKSYFTERGDLDIPLPHYLLSYDDQPILDKILMKLRHDENKLKTITEKGLSPHLMYEPNPVKHTSPDFSFENPEKFRFNYNFISNENYSVCNSISESRGGDVSSNACTRSSERNKIDVSSSPIEVYACFSRLLLCYRRKSLFIRKRLGCMKKHSNEHVKPNKRIFSMISRKRLKHLVTMSNSPIGCDTDCFSCCSVCNNPKVDRKHKDEMLNLFDYRPFESKVAAVILFFVMILQFLISFLQTKILPLETFHDFIVMFACVGNNLHKIIDIDQYDINSAIGICILITIVLVIACACFQPPVWFLNQPKRRHNRDEIKECLQRRAFYAGIATPEEVGVGHALVPHSRTSRNVSPYSRTA